MTVVADRESDIYAEWARLPGPRFHLLTRAMHDRALAEGGRLSTASLEPAGEAGIELVARAGRPARRARLAARFGRVTLKRPGNTREAGLPKTVVVSLVEVVEPDPPPGAAPILWRLLTTHEVTDAAMAWRVVGWYRARWTIEQLFRTLKQQGLRLEDSQLETAEGLLKLTAIAARAACGRPASTPKSPAPPCGGPLSNSSRRATAAAAKAATSLLRPPKSKPSKPCARASKAQPLHKKILIRRGASPGPLGSSPNSAVGMDTNPRSRQVP